MKEHISIRFLFLVLPALLLQSCFNRQIPELENIEYTPEYFHNTMLFGKDPGSLVERNKYTIATGFIDTNSEQHVVEIAYISIRKSLVELHRTRSQNIPATEMSEEYAGNGIHILLKYKPLIATNGDSYTSGSCFIDSGAHSYTMSIVGKKGFD